MKVDITNWRNRNYKTKAIQILGSSSPKLKSPKQKVVEQARLEKPPLNVQCGKVQASQRLKSFKKKLGLLNHESAISMLVRFACCNIC